MTFEIDYMVVKENFVIKNQKSIWGKSRFGDRFINNNVNASLPFSIGRRGRTIRFTFRNGFEIGTPVSTVDELDVYLGKKEGLLVKVTSTNQYFSFTNGAWVEQAMENLNQAMRIYSVSGDYELRGKR